MSDSNALINSDPAMHSACPACSCRKLYKPSFFRKCNLRRCCVCGLTFETKIPSDEELTAYYRVYSYKSLRPCSEATQSSYQRVLKTFEHWKGKRRILDLGCGQGDFLLQAQASGWQAKGFEFSESAVALCRSRCLDVVQGSSAMETFNGECFDVITAFEVIEHLRKPADLLNTASQLLTKGGLLYLTTPNFNAALRFIQRDEFYILDYPGHLCIFTPQSLRRIAKQHGFRVAKLNATGIDPLRLAAALGLKRPATRPLAAPPAQAKQALPTPSLSDLDILRDSISSNPVATTFKRAANGFLNASGLGDSLKAWLVKI